MDLTSKYFAGTSNPQYSQFIALSRYARWLDDKNRRETWEETVDRYIAFFKNHLDSFIKVEKNKVSNKEWTELRNAILHLEVMPSMRALMTAGDALTKCNIAGYNCSYIAIDHPRCFDEAMFILLNGTGVGFSVERQFIVKLPDVAEEFHPTETTIKVGDSKKGWAKAFRELIAMLYAGQIPNWDMSAVRPAGARLKTFGGRASGPEPLDKLFRFTVDIFKKAHGRKLNSLECHDLMCKVGEVVVVGGVRRSAMISLSNLSDTRMRDAKKGQFWFNESQRSLSNNSACYTEKPEFTGFMQEWVALYESKTGERGIFNRVAAKKQAAKSGRRDADWEFGTNPCGEIILRPNGFCNLTEIVVRATDTVDDLRRKARLATLLGTIQATLTDFPYLRSIWKKNAEEECLLGVSMTGIMDHPILSGLDKTTDLAELLVSLKDSCIEANAGYADRFGINRAAAITCTKPSGTVSQLVDSASGIHERYSPFYIRRVRADVKDPLAVFMKESNFPCESDITNPSNLVFSFPIQSPKGKIEERSAIEQLEHWKTFKENWCEHNPSVTIYYSDDEYLGVGQWVWENFDTISGVSFLPKLDHVYQQAPYEEITMDQFVEMTAGMPTDVDWARLAEYEKEDTTTGTQTMACSGGVCEIVDLTQ